MGIPYNCTKWCSATTYQMVNSSVVSKGAMNSSNEMFPLARMFPLAVMHRVYLRRKDSGHCSLLGRKSPLVQMKNINCGHFEKILHVRTNSIWWIAISFSKYFQSFLVIIISESKSGCCFLTEFHNESFR